MMSWELAIIMKEVKVTIDHRDGRIHIPPNSTFRDFKWNALFATGSNIPIGTMELLPRTMRAYDEDIVDTSNVTNYNFMKAYRYCYGEYRQY